MLAAQPEREINTSRKLRIGIISETFSPEVNGVANTVGQLVNGLLHRGHQVHLTRPTQGRYDPGNHGINGTPVETACVRGFKIPGYPELRFGLVSGKFFKQLWKINKPDIIYIATEGPLGWVAATQARQHNIPALSGFHTNFHSYSRHYNIGFLQRPIYRYLRNFHNQTTSTLVPTTHQKESLIQGGFSNVEVLGRGVDNKLFSPEKRSTALREHWGAAADDPVLLYVGRLAAEKNLPLAIHAYQAMRKLNPRLRFVIVGDGPLYKNLYSNDKDLIFCSTKRGEELARHYASADIFLFPSETETFGNVTLEAMASGLAVIAYDYAAAHTHIQHGESGLLAEFGNNSKFIDAGLALANDRPQIKKLRTNARSIAQSSDWQYILDRFQYLLLQRC
jgi:glycosyltransferase involved in cell wall biosynthesis